MSNGIKRCNYVFVFSALQGDQGYEFESRGEIEVKGKGLMHTHFLLSSSVKLPPLSPSQKGSSASSTPPTSTSHGQKSSRNGLNRISSGRKRRSSSANGSVRGRSAKSALCSIL